MTKTLLRAAVIAAAFAASACGPQLGETVTAQPPPGTACEWSHSPAEGPPGTPITFTGVARFGDTPITARPRLSLRAGQPGTPYDFSGGDPQQNDAAGNFTRVLRVPVDAPPGDYRVTSTCFAGDQGIAGTPTEGDFVVLQGPPITTPTTTPTEPESPTTTVLSRTG